MKTIRTHGPAALVCAGLVLAAALAAAQGPGGAATADKPATLIIRLPADARLVVDEKATEQTGEVRRFYSPPLPPGRTFRYTLEATWTSQGKTVLRKRVARVRAGEETRVDFLEEEKPAGGPPDRGGADKPPDRGADKGADKGAEPERRPDVVFVPTPQAVVDRMLELANVTKDDVVYDLGCGDGRIVVTAAKKYGCKAYGFDVDPERIAESKENVKKNGVEDLVTIEKKDIFKLDLSKASVVTLYLLPSLNVKLVPQLEKLKPGSRIVSHAFDMEGYKPKEVVKVKADGEEHRVFLWVTPLEKEK
jgi:uncharacterized protein (TIGR03000 family)